MLEEKNEEIKPSQDEGSSSQKILRHCQKHGELYFSDVIKNGVRSGKQQYKCRQCMKVLHANHYEKNKTKIKEKHNKYRKENRSHYLMLKKKSALKHKFKDIPAHRLAEAYSRHKEEVAKQHAENHIKWKHAQMRIDRIDDEYIKYLLVKRSNLERKDLPPELIECKRITLILKRNIRKIRDKKIYDYLENKNVKNKKC